MEYQLQFKLDKVRPVRDDINAALDETWGHATGDSFLHWKHNGSQWVLTVRLHAEDDSQVQEFKSILQAKLQPIKIDNDNSLAGKCELCGEKEPCNKCGGEK